MSLYVGSFHTFQLSGADKHQNHLTAVLYYDYLLTLDDEIELLWKRAGISPMSILFILNRYIGLVGPIPVIFEFFTFVSPIVSECLHVIRFCF